MTPKEAFLKAVKVEKRAAELEAVVLTDPHYSFHYAQKLLAKKLIEGRWKEAEPIILTSPSYAYRYANEIIKGRWKEAEPIILTSPDNACRYAKEIIKGRWGAAEPVIITEPQCVVGYARDVINGKFPEELHNKILKTNYYGKEFYGQGNYIDDYVVFVSGERGEQPELKKRNTSSTFRCRVCNTDFTVEYDRADMDRWKNGESYLQDTLSYLTADERELIYSGTCGKCFDEGSNSDTAEPRKATKATKATKKTKKTKK